MKKFLKTRKGIRTLSYSVFVLACLIGSSFAGYALAHKYRQDLEYTYLKSLNELSEYVSNIEITLNKSLYANTSTQQHGVATKLMSQTTGAKSALEQLPLSFEELGNINKFISQVGDFSSYLSNNISKGIPPTEEEINNLQNLAQYAKKVNNSIKDVISEIENNHLHIGDAQNAYAKLSDSTQNKDSSFNAGFKDINSGFNNFPSLIYDGPFSDHITKKESTFLADKQEISLEEAKNKASTFLEVNPDLVEHLGEINNNLPVYKFKNENSEISVTKKGGFVRYLIKDREVKEENLGYKCAFNKAREFFRKNNMPSVKESYYIIENGICTINYAFYKDNIIHYPDLIKIGVALDNGELLRFDATGYLMNHQERTLPPNIIPIETARGSVSKRLSINKENLVFIPSSGLKEVFCYEFECTGKDNERVLVYINGSTGFEEQILIIISSDKGTLVM